MGKTKRYILTQFLIEAIVITFVGGLIRIAIGIGGPAYLVSLATNIPFVISIPAIIIAVGVVFGLHPARRAAQLSPIGAFCYEYYANKL